MSEKIRKMLPLVEEPLVKGKKELPLLTFIEGENKKVVADLLEHSLSARHGISACSEDLKESQSRMFGFIAKHYPEFEGRRFAVKTEGSKTKMIDKNIAIVLQD